MITTLIFDMDGVLIDLCDIHRDCFKSALKTVVGLDISNDYHFECLNGLPTRIKLEKLGVSKENAIKINELKQELTTRAIEEIKPDKELQNIISGLHWNFRVFCVSNSTRKTVEMTLAKLGILRRFDGFIGNDDVFMTKPSPEGYFKAMCVFGASTSQTLAIEDSAVGEETIKKAGVHGLIIKNRSELTFERVLQRVNEIV